MNKRGLLIVLSGPSGVGKGTVLRSYLEKNPNTRPVSYTHLDVYKRQHQDKVVHYNGRTSNRRADEFGYAETAGAGCDFTDTPATS